MPANPSGADALANDLLDTLLDGKEFTVPDIDTSGVIFAQPEQSGDLHALISKLTAEDLTTGQVGGSGMFDRLMVSLVSHLKVEYESNRISGAEYTKAYISVVTAALTTATQYLLGRDQAYWQAMLVQQQAQMTEIEAVRARLELETSRVQLARAQYEASTAEANYGLMKIKIAVEDITYSNLEKTGIMIAEQAEAQRAQTLDTRSDGTTPVAGSIGKQKELYTQQITSYQRDAETKFAKMLSDAWITQKTIDEGLVAPDQFTNTEINEVISSLRTNLSLQT